MSEFKKGQRVHVEFDGEVDWQDDLVLQVKSGGTSRMVRLDTFNTKVTLLDPPDWPPRVGDIWEAEGWEWFAQSSFSAGIVMRPDDTVRARRELCDFKALNPVLVRRRGQ